MGISFYSLRQQKEEAGELGLYTADKRYWLTVDRKRVVADGDPEAAFLLAAPGQEMSVHDAVKYGLMKAVEKPADKAMPAPTNKGKGKA